MFRKIFIAAAGVIAAGTLSAEISFNAQTNTIIVDNFGKDIPCTMKTIQRADKINGWNKVQYDKAADTYSIDANLTIGQNNGNDTYFQLGSREQPKETLVVKGNVTVYPYYIKGRNQAREAGLHDKKNVNRLTIGIEEDKTVTPTLKIYSDTQNKNGLFVGWFFEKTLLIMGSGGEICVYNATVTAAVQDKAHAFGGPDPARKCLIYGMKNIFKNSTISWFAGFFIYDNKYWKFEFDNVVFADGGEALVSPVRNLQNLTFKNMGMAVYDYGDVNCTLTDCIFENNVKNWYLRFKARLILVDCQIGIAKDDEVNNAMPDKKYTQLVESRRHILVKAAGTDGSAITGAKVTVVCENGKTEESVENSSVSTGSAGLTPEKGSREAILLTEYRITSESGLRSGKKTELSYAVTVEKDGKKAEMKGFKPLKSWETLTLVLK